MPLVVSRRLIGTDHVTLRKDFVRVTNQSADNAELTVISPVGEIGHILFVTVKYSAAVIANVTVTLTSGVGSAWNTILETIALSSATDGIWIPDQPIFIADDDSVDVVAPAGGPGVTSAVAIYAEIDW